LPPPPRGYNGEYDAGHLGLMSDSKTVAQEIEKAATASVH
jgi:hypothetical protein